ncbi:MAG: peptide ABC transporter ATP-binding protein, partial [Clostridia bacterium]|nr:peptide ABC transporter ATP-binding protein [Clostridia bacterium]
HDTGSLWYTLGSLFLPPIGLIAGFIFKKFNHIRNFKACLKGAIAGFSILGTILALFGFFLLLAVL